MARITDDAVVATIRSSRSLGAKRMRRHRRRRQLGLHCVTVLIRKAEIDALIRKGFLTPGDKRDRKALVEAAGEELLEDISAALAKQAPQTN